jgi:hypothetical protein
MKPRAIGKEGVQDGNEGKRGGGRADAREQDRWQACRGFFAVMVHDRGKTCQRWLGGV